MKESAVSIVYRAVAELPAGATFTSVSLARDLDGFDPSLVSACFRAIKEDRLAIEVGVGPGRTIIHQRTAMPGRDRKFKAGLKKPRTMSREPGYTIPNAGRPDLPRIAGGPAPRPDLEGRKVDADSLGSDPFPNADRLDATEKVEVVLDEPRNGPASAPGSSPEKTLLAQLFGGSDPRRLSVRLREIADEVERVENAIEAVSRGLGIDP